MATMHTYYLGSQQTKKKKKSAAVEELVLSAETIRPAEYSILQYPNPQNSKCYGSG